MPEATDPIPLKRNPWFWAFVLGMLVLPLLRPCGRYVPEPPPVLDAAAAASLGSLKLFDQEGRTPSLTGRVLLLGFAADGRPTANGAMMAAMRRLQEGVLTAPDPEAMGLISVHGTGNAALGSEELRAGARELGARSGTWQLVTGTPTERRRLAEGLLGRSLEDGEAPPGRLLILIDDLGRVRGRYELAAEVPVAEAVQEAYFRAERTAREAFEERGGNARSGGRDPATE